MEAADQLCFDFDEAQWGFGSDAEFGFLVAMDAFLFDMRDDELAELASIRDSFEPA